MYCVKGGSGAGHYLQGSCQADFSQAAASGYVGLLSDNRLYVLLSNARRQDAVPVMERLAAIGCRSEIMEEYEQ